jgi:tetratricopeptide (TPR) repeat protein
MDEPTKQTRDLMRQAEEKEKSFPEEALSIWRALSQSSNDIYVLLKHGRLGTKLGLWQEAEQSLLRAFRVNSNVAEIYDTLGLLYMKRDDIADKTSSLKMAREYFQRGLQLEEIARRLTLLGVTNLELEEMTTAESNFREAIKLDPNYAEAYFNLAVMMPEEMKEQRIMLLRKAVQLDPDYAPGHRELGWTYRKQNNYKDAEDHLNAAVKLDPMDGTAWLYLGNLLWSTDRTGLAEEAFKRVLELSPKDSLSYASAGIFYKDQNQLDKAKSLFERAIELEPTSARNHWRLGQVLMSCGEITAAKDHLLQALELDPSDAKAADLLHELEESGG